MKLVMPTNWDDALVPEYKKLGIAECYGKLAVDVVGGGRSAFILPNVSRARVAGHIRKLHGAGIKFNYLLNAACGSFREFSRSGDKEVRKLLGWLADAGVDSVTVTSPYFLQMIKKKYPVFKICVSTNAEVASLQKALFWQDFGADQITLSHNLANRDFALIRLLKKKVSCELRLIANTSCLLDCPLSRYHTAYDAHSSQADSARRPGFAVDYCNLFCKFIRLSDPVRFISSQWIRPEDLAVYESAGIGTFKLIDRRCSTEKLLLIARAYSGRRYDGNLVDLLPIFHGKTVLDFRTLPLKLRYFFHPRELNLFSLVELGSILQDFRIRIDNTKLNGFIEKFVTSGCPPEGCSDCGYCARVAGEALSYDKEYLISLRERYGNFLKKFVNGDLFHY